MCVSSFSAKDNRSIDDLLEFINEQEGDSHKTSSKAAKRKRRKQRKVVIFNLCIDFNVHMHLHLTSRALSYIIHTNVPIDINVCYYLIILS